MSNDVLIKVDNVSKKFCRTLKRSLWYGVQDVAGEMFGRKGVQNDLRSEEFWAVKDVSFKLKRGESLGLIGRNGAGKSTLLKLLNGLVKPDAGRITIRGRIGALIELGAGFNPILTGRENIYNNAAVLGLSRRRTDEVFDDIINFSGIEEFIDTPVQNYSTGMRVRLGYAVAAYLRPDVLLVDEVLAVGDTGFQRKCLQHMRMFLKQGGSLILVSHNMHLIQSMCDRCLLVDEGMVSFGGNTTEAVNCYYELQNPSQITNGSQPAIQLNDENPLIIEGIDISSTSGGDIRSGEGVKLCLRYHSIKDIAGVTWGFSIWTGDQWVRITTCGSKYSGHEYQITKGKGRLSCILPDLPLVAGIYVLRAGIYDAETSWPIARIGWEDAAIPFTVKASVSEFDNRRFVDGDIIAMNVDWMVS
jgi:ABC-type polysaccharide/polyol phosphate transport system ATPase subunit